MEPTQDETFMRQTLTEARRGLGFTSPNPMVGALIVKNGREVGRGFHARDGEAHAETQAIAALTNPNDANGATLYVNLEPCCHHGRTPPCTNAVIRSGIARVVVANLDPDHRVAGEGVAQLSRAGIVVETGVLAQEGENLNSIYFHFRRTGRPYVVAKAALTLDGKIAARTGDSKWISGEKSRHIAHQLRARLRGLVVGAGTLKADRPRLNCRLPGLANKQVDKIIFSRNSRDSLQGEGLLHSIQESPGRVHVVNPESLSKPSDFLNFCAAQSIDSVLVEGGRQVHTWFVKNELADRFFLFYRPAFLGNDGVSVVDAMGLDRIADLKDWKINSIEKVDDNIMIDLARGEPLCLLG